MENRNRLGFRDDDELIAVIVVLLLVAILAFYFIRGFGQRQATQPTEEPVVAVEQSIGDAVDSAESAIDGATGAIAVDATANGSGSAEVAAPDADADLAVAPLVATAPPILTSNNRFKFGPVLVTGTGDPDTSVALSTLVDTTEFSVGDARVNATGNFSYTVPAGQLLPGDHTFVATSGEFRSEPQTLTLDSPEAPTLAANWNNAVAEPKQYQVSGYASPNWWVAVGVAGAEPVQIKTDDSGFWEATVALDEVGTYELEVFAVDPGSPERTVNFDASTGVNRIIVTADGQPPTDAVVEEAPATEDNAAQEATDAEAAAAAQAEADAAAQAEADAAAAAEAEAAAQAEADAAAAAEAEAVAQAEAEAAAQAEADAAAEAAATNLYAQLQSTGQHNILVAAVDAVGLRETLEQQEEKLTLFAPTDNAFGRLPEGTVDTLLANPDTLRAVLAEHVVAGELRSDGISAETANVTNIADHVLPILVENGSVSVSGSNVTQVDISASNGVIHAIDTIILPPSEFAPPVIDVRGVPIFKGTFLTVVGTGQSGSNLILTLNDVKFGEQIIGEDGTFQIAGDITDGEYTIIAYSYDDANVLRAISTPVKLIVDNS